MVARVLAHQEVNSSLGFSVWLKIFCKFSSSFFLAFVFLFWVAAAAAAEAAEAPPAGEDRPTTLLIGVDAFTPYHFKNKLNLLT